MDDSSLEEGAERAQGSWSAAPPPPPPPPAAFTDEARAPLVLPPPPKDWRNAFRKRGDAMPPPQRKFLDLVKRIGVPKGGPVPRPLRDRAPCQPPRGPGARPALSMLARVRA